MTHERMTVPRKGSFKPAREKKSAPLATCIKQKQERNMQRTGRVGANDGETGQLLGDGEDHHSESAFLALIQPMFPCFERNKSAHQVETLEDIDISRLSL